jgi:hypothetical protein
MASDRKNTLAKKFCRCIKKVGRTLKNSRGVSRDSSKEQASIAICVRSVLGSRGRTLKKFKCRGKKPQLKTQKLDFVK